MREINVAIIGCGEVADGHIKAWRKVSESKIEAVCDLNEDLARSTAESWKIPKFYRSFSELVKQKSINLVDICTPPHTHADIAVIENPILVFIFISFICNKILYLRKTLDKMVLQIYQRRAFQQKHCQMKYL